MGFLAPFAISAATSAFPAMMGAVGAGGVAGTAAASGIGTGLLSAGIGAAGSIIQGISGYEQGQYTAKVAQQNAQIEKRNAAMAGAEGEANVGIAETKNRARMGALLADQGASGVDVSSGSNVDVRSSAAQLGELDALTIRSDAAKKAYGFQTSASQYLGQAASARSGATGALASGLFGAGTTLLGGYGTATSAYNDYLLKGGITSHNDGSVGPINWSDGTVTQ